MLKSSSSTKTPRATVLPGDRAAAPPSLPACLPAYTITFLLPSICRSPTVKPPLPCRVARGVNTEVGLDVVLCFYGGPRAIRRETDPSFPEGEATLKAQCMSVSVSENGQMPEAGKYQTGSGEQTVKGSVMAGQVLQNDSTSK
ncbi:hypothetical protein ACOMHN_020365 [Nucella lapillus]